MAYLPETVKSFGTTLWGVSVLVFALPWCGVLYQPVAAYAYFAAEGLDNAVPNSANPLLYQLAKGSDLLFPSE